MDHRLSDPFHMKNIVVESLGKRTWKLIEEIGERYRRAVSNFLLIHFFPCGVIETYF